MKKLELVESLKSEYGISRNEASVIVNLVFGKNSEALPAGNRVEVRGFCSLVEILARASL